MYLCKYHDNTKILRQHRSVYMCGMVEFSTRYLRIYICAVKNVCLVLTSRRTVDPTIGNTFSRKPMPFNSNRRTLLASRVHLFMYVSMHVCANQPTHNIKY